MRICFIVSEYFEWGQLGGYGTITRALAEGLVQRGHQVFALVPKRTKEAKLHQPDVGEIAGVTVIGLPHSYLARIGRRHLYRMPAADIYVNVDARFDSWLAMKLNPKARHCIWFIDPMDFDTFWSRHNEDPGNAGNLEKLRMKLVFETLQFFGRRAVRGADILLAQSQQGCEIAHELFRTSEPVLFAPNPVDVPEGTIEKAPAPVVLFLGRFDWQKQPGTFFTLAPKFPDVQFVAAGAASDPSVDRELRERFAGIPNLSLPGVVRGAEKTALLRRSWILCNTSLREGLPRSFQEALAHRCAILSALDPDSYVSRFGYHARDRDFQTGLRSLLEENRWRALGDAGHEAIRATHGCEHAIDTHESIYGDSPR
jgi:glycosyltransferase involved in cell wall biosynthesis